MDGTDERAVEERLFQFGIRSILLATGTIAVLLAVMRCLNFPKFFIFVVTMMLVVEVCLVFSLFLFDAVAAQIGKRKPEGESDPKERASDEGA